MYIYIYIHIYLLMDLFRGSTPWCSAYPGPASRSRLHIYIYIYIYNRNWDLAEWICRGFLFSTKKKKKLEMICGLQHLKSNNNIYIYI